MKKYLLIYLLLVFSNIAFGKNAAFDQGVEHLSKKEFIEAKKSFLIAIEERPDFSAYYNLGIANGKLEDWQAARWAFEASLKYRPSSTKARYNARFATVKIDSNLEWEHPYSWVERLILAIHGYIWLILTIVAAILIGAFVYNYVAKTKNTVLNKWLKRFLVPTAILFAISFFSLIYQRSLLVEPHFAIIKNKELKSYISPNGIEIEYELNPKVRLEIIDSFEDDLWLYVKSEDKTAIWVRSSDLYWF